MFEVPLSAEYVIQENKYRVVHAPPIIVLLHDYGENPSTFLEQLNSCIDSAYYVISVRGPIVLGGNKFGWFEPNSADGFDAEGFEKAKDYLEGVLNNIFMLARPKISIFRCSLMGFGQGAAVALDMAGRQTETFSDIIAIEGAVWPDWVDVVDPDHTYMKDIFVISGADDPTFSTNKAKAICEELSRLRWRVHHRTYDAGHVLAPEMLEDIQRLIDPKNHSQHFSGIYEYIVECPKHLEARYGTSKFKYR